MRDSSFSVVLIDFIYKRVLLQDICIMLFYLFSRSPLLKNAKNLDQHRLYVIAYFPKFARNFFFYFAVYICYLKNIEF